MDFNWAQAKAYKAVTTSLQQNAAPRLAVDMPTGSGKSYLVARVLQDYWGRVPRTLVMTYSRTLREDLVDTFRDQTPGLAGHVEQYIVGQGAARAPIAVATYNSGMKALREGLINPAHLDCIILDEGHLALAPERQKILRELQVPQLALTATTAYARDKSLAFAGYKTVYQLGLRAAVDGGLLVPFQSCVHELMGTYPNLRHVKMRGSDFDIESLDAALSLKEFISATADLLCNWKQPDSITKTLMSRKSIGFCAGIGSAEAMAIAMNARMGANFSAAVHSDMDDKKRKRILQEHKAGDIRWLFSADYLIHGHDDPGIDGVVNLSPTRSAVKAGQRPGRMMRLDPLRPYKEGLCFELLYGQDSGQILHGDLMGGFIFKKRAKAQKQDNEPAQPVKATPETSGRTYFSASELKNLASTRETLRLQETPPPVLTEVFAQAVEEDGRPFDVILGKAIDALGVISPMLVAGEHFLVQTASGQHKPTSGNGEYSYVAHAWAIALKRSVDEIFPEPEAAPACRASEGQVEGFDKGYLDRLQGTEDLTDTTLQQAMLKESFDRLMSYHGYLSLSSTPRQRKHGRLKHEIANAYIRTDASMREIGPSFHLSGDGAGLHMRSIADDMKEFKWPEVDQLREALGDLECFYLCDRYREVGVSPAPDYSYYFRRAGLEP